MPDSAFEDPQLAALYDAMSPWNDRSDFGLYFPMVMAAESVLDVGCGTGALLHRARETGHAGRLCGLDPALGMLEQARKRSDVEWVHGDLSALSPEDGFDLIVMSGHAFQVFISDDEIHQALSAIRDALTDEGRFAFESRNPLAREWERWRETYRGTVEDPSGARVRHACEVHQPLQDELVKFSHTFTSPDWPESQVSHSTLRFLSEKKLDRFLAQAGLQVDERYGDWDRSPVTETSPEIITIARRC